MTTIVIRVTEVIVDKLGVEPEQVTMETRFAEDMGSDSLDTLEVVETLSSEFDFIIPDEALEKMVTVGHVVEYIEKHAKHK